MKLGLMMLLVLLAACDGPEIGGSPSEVCHAEDGSCEWNEAADRCDCRSNAPATDSGRVDAGN